MGVRSIQAKFSHTHRNSTSFWISDYQHRTITRHLKTSYLKGRDVIRAKYNCSHSESREKALKKELVTPPSQLQVSIISFLNLGDDKMLNLMLYRILMADEYSQTSPFKNSLFALKSLKNVWNKPIEGAKPHSQHIVSKAFINKMELRVNIREDTL